VSASVRATAVGKRLPRSFYRRDPREVAPDLLNKVLIARDGRAARIVETEAYCGPFDAAAHSYRGQTPRNAVMFGEPGLLYVYFTYGMHYCCNAVCGELGEGVAVLIRAAEPIAGLDLIRAARPAAKRDRDLCSGPARLCQAFGIDRRLDGADLVTADHGLAIIDDGVPPPDVPAVGPRIGIRHAAEEPWRYYVRGNPHVSKP
jgi:DNA-3-methyladenine glycosylase